jgi:hypothetical protein
MDESNDFFSYSNASTTSNNTVMSSNSASFLNLNPQTIPILTSNINSNANNSQLLLKAVTKPQRLLGMVKDDCDWANSLFRPASRFTLKRRECKSTSDESFIFEINASTASSGASIVKTQNTLEVNVGRRNEEDFLCLQSGKFGNPSLIATTAARRSLSSFNNNSISITPQLVAVASSSFKKNFSFSHNTNTSERNDFSATTTTTTTKSHAKGHHHHHHGVKRLSASNRFFIENHSKKSQEKKDFAHNKKLFHAINGSEYSQVVDLLDSNLYDINCFDDKQRTCLHIAASKGNLEIARLLLSYGANPNLRDCVCNLPIHLAIISSHVPVVTLLLEAGTDINTLDLNGKTVLHLAGTRLRWLLNDENNKASPKLKIEAIMIMNMIKEYLRQKKTSTNDLDILTTKLESVFTLDDINCLTKELLNKFDSLNITKLPNSDASSM